jgi:hypothetical protein
MYATLRGCSVDQDALEGLKTLETLIKLWARTQEDKAIHLMQAQKIAWGEVLKRGAPHETKKIKGQVVHRLVSPTKPSKSPWCSAKERQKLSNLFAPMWSKPDLIRDEWVKLDAKHQHIKFDTYVSRLRDTYIEMNATSQAVLARLGHRKQWVYSVVKATDNEPTGKEKKKDPFTWATIFYKQDLTKLRETVKMIFSPAHYLETRWWADELASHLFAQNYEIDYIPWESISTNTDLSEIFKHWLERFKPSLKVKVNAPTSQEVESINPFSILEEASASA